MDSHTSLQLFLRNETGCERNGGAFRKKKQEKLSNCWSQGNRPFKRWTRVHLEQVPEVEDFYKKYIAAVSKLFRPCTPFYISTLFMHPQTTPNKKRKEKKQSLFIAAIKLDQ